MITVPTEPKPVNSNYGNGSTHAGGSPQNAEDFPQGQITSSAWEGWWHQFPPKTENCPQRDSKTVPAEAGTSKI